MLQALTSPVSFFSPLFLCLSLSRLFAFLSHPAYRCSLSRSVPLTLLTDCFSFCLSSSLIYLLIERIVFLSVSDLLFSVSLSLSLCPNLTHLFSLCLIFFDLTRCLYLSLSFFFQREHVKQMQQLCDNSANVTQAHIAGWRLDAESYRILAQGLRHNTHLRSLMWVVTHQGEWKGVEIYR